MAKKPMEKAPTGLYRAVRPAGIDGNSCAGIDGGASQGVERQLGRKRSLISRRFVTNLLQNAVTSKPIATSATGMAGIIDLIAKLGSLSVLSVPPSTFGPSLDNASPYIPTPFSYLVDVTLNPTELTTFYILRVKAQPLLATELSINLATQLVQDILVSFQARFLNSGSIHWRGTFKRLDPCFAWTTRASGEMQAYSNNPLDSNVTTLVTPGGTPGSLAPPDPLLQPVPPFILTSADNLASSAPPTSDPTRPRVIGDLEFVSQPLVESGGSGEEMDEGVLVVFRRTHGAPGKYSNYSQGVKLEVKRGLGGDNRSARFEPELADDEPSK
ncbi:hypothetical protein FRC10_010461 [Ceratobasidium sp. 414]|nr:hypothetical protein FRC10_010461 [Ceratobasidium sp. 414]